MTSVNPSASLRGLTAGFATARGGLAPLIPLALLVAAPVMAQELDWQARTVGTVSFPNSGAPEAQEAFIYSLAQLHNFEYASAAEGFRRAREIDPDFFMAYWGEAMSHNHPVWMEQDADAARRVMALLGGSAEVQLARAPTERERDWWAALEVLYGEGAKEERDDTYAGMMRMLHEKYPTDPEAAAFYALSLLGTAHEGRDIPTYMRAAAILEDAVDENPNHPGIVHYLIHSYDDPIHAPLGLRAARAYAEIAPDAAHAQHMTSHIFVAVGAWDDVVGANDNAVAVVDRVRAADGRDPSACGHYNFWLEYGYLQQERPDDALRLVRQCFDRVRGTSGSDEPDPDNAPVGSFAQMRARYLIDTEDWKSEVIGWKPELDGRPFASVTYAFGTGFAAAQRGDLDEARRALAQLVDAAAEAERRWQEGGQGEGELPRRPGILVLQLQAVILASQGEMDEAIARGRQAAETEAQLPFVFGPPFVDKPSYELLGELLLRAGRIDEAARAFETAVARTPGRLRAVRGLEQGQVTRTSATSR